MYKNFHYTVTPLGCIVTEYSGHDEIVEIPEEINGRKVIEIGNCAFISNTRIKEVIIPDGVDLIGHYAFAGCSKLEKMVLPESICKIFSNAFKDNNSLKKIQFNGTKEQWNDIHISVKNDNIYNAKISFNKQSELSKFLNICKDTEEIRKE